ncbi:zinc carboxypeptidase [Octopus bimaculoides]|uniref:Peptidase M14 domain-containing protein n=1 Tax=Octopus bimaculoides TaxID=37653 RepID=A0A0L8FMS2_OCTBM|nr:zinc carboxypeptidase [Octopus bimaculoides]|eukprot:XP_014788672.1 PREDICTED: zinc carboxypeptidase-like [Octopus bimaculoides]
MNRRRSQGMKVFILFLFCLSLAESKKYTNYHLLKVVPQTDTGLAQLKSLDKNNPQEVDFWIAPSKVNQSAECLMSPTLYHEIENGAKNKGIEVTVLSDNIEKTIEKEKPNSVLYSEKAVTNTYAPIEKIVELIKGYAEQYSHVSLKHYGKSYEHRNLYAIKFSVGPGRQTIIVEAGMHSREWIAIASTLKVIESFATRRNVNREVTELLESYDWLFVPVTNPDGYHMTHTEDRMWRKNMRPHTRRCTGTDLNRNFDALWGGEGASADPCHPTFRGANVFSEPESRHLSKLVRSTRDKIAFFSVHAYSQLILTPYGCQRKKPADSNHLTYIAKQAKNAIYRETGKNFTVGTPPDILYPATGGAYDWAKMKMKVKYAYAFELRPDPSSSLGFIMPESEIEPSYRELFVALKAFAENFEK